MSHIQKITQEIVPIGSISSFSLVGDPCCKGIGTSMLRIYMETLYRAGEDDFTMILGDLVPRGYPQFYRFFENFTELAASNDIYGLRGNHDVNGYSQVLGLHNYALMARDFTIIALDNASGSFEEEGLDLTRRVLAMDDVKNVILAFHIPLPNHFKNKNVSESEADRLRAAIAEGKDKVRYIVCGHVHSRYEDVFDGIPMLCIGGGGAPLEDLNDEIKASDVRYHLCRFWLMGGKLHYHYEEIRSLGWKKESGHEILRRRIEDAIHGEMYTHLRYRVMADRAVDRGYPQIANLFRALAESEYRHARNFYLLLEHNAPLDEMMASFHTNESYLAQTHYPAISKYAYQEGAPLTSYAFDFAAKAEEIHEELLQALTDPDQYQGGTLYVCPICGNVMPSIEGHLVCDVCGSYCHSFIKFEA